MDVDVKFALNRLQRKEAGITEQQYAECLAEIKSNSLYANIDPVELKKILTPDLFFGLKVRTLGYSNNNLSEFLDAEPRSIPRYFSNLYEVLNVSDIGICNIMLMDLKILSPKDWYPYFPFCNIKRK